MKKINKKTWIIIGIIVLVLIIAGVILALVNKKDSNMSAEGSKGPEAVTREGIIKEETFNGLTFSNVMLLGRDENNNYVMTMDVTNNTDADITQEEVGITLKDKDGNKIVTLKGYIGKDPIKPKETKQISSSTNLDLRNAYTKEIGEFTE